MTLAALVLLLPVQEAQAAVHVDHNKDTSEECVAMLDPVLDSIGEVSKLDIRKKSANEVSLHWDGDESCIFILAALSKAEFMGPAASHKKEIQALVRRILSSGDISSAMDEGASSFATPPRKPTPPPRASASAEDETALSESPNGAKPEVPEEPIDPCDEDPLCIPEEIDIFNLEMANEMKLERIWNACQDFLRAQMARPDSCDSPLLEKWHQHQTAQENKKTADRSHSEAIAAKKPETHALLKAGGAGSGAIIIILGGLLCFAKRKLLPKNWNTKKKLEIQSLIDQLSALRSEAADDLITEMQAFKDTFEGETIRSVFFKLKKYKKRAKNMITNGEG